MRLAPLRVSGFIAFCLLFAAFIAWQTNASGSGNTSSAGESSALSSPYSEASASSRIADNYGRLPLRFEKNEGQSASQVKFLSRGNAYALFLTSNEAKLVLRRRPASAGLPAVSTDESLSSARDVSSAVIGLKLVGMNSSPQIIATDEQPGKSHYYAGNDPQQWRVNISGYSRVRYQEVYPGIDLVWHGDQRQLEHDFIIAPGANPARIKWQFNGIRQITIADDGALLLATEAGELKWHKPVAWQEINGARREVACAYRLNARREVMFTIGRYDRRQPLIIDPILIYSTYLGGLSNESFNAIAVDKDGNAYVAGFTASSDFPAASTIQQSNNGQTDAFVVKLNPAGSQLVYATWLGGDSEEAATGIKVDADGSAVVVGSTVSTNFPTTSGALQMPRGNVDSFITRINPAGSALTYSAVFGGNGLDQILGVTLDASGNAYVTGRTDSTNLPATGFQTSRRGNLLFKSTSQGATWNVSDNGIPSGNITTFVVDPVSPTTLYAGTLGQGIYKTTDGGASWQRLGLLFNAINQPQIYALAVDPVSPTTLYAGTSFSLYKSTNGGQTWEAKGNGLNTGSGNPVFFFYSITIDPTTPQIVYTGTQNGVFKSTNGGNSWVAVNNGLIPPFTTQQLLVYRIVVNNAMPTTVHIATSRGVYRTTDGGQVWVLASNGLPGGTPVVGELVAEPRAPDTLYLVTNTQGGQIYKTTDGGDNWALVNSGVQITVNGQPFLVRFRTLAVDATVPSRLYATVLYIGIFKSSDGGVTWAEASSGLPPQSMTAVITDRAGNVYAGTASGTDAFVAKVAADGSALSYLTYLGGDAVDSASGIAVDSSGSAYITGTTSSTNFPTLNSFQPASAGNSDAFITKLNSSGSALLWSTYLGGNAVDTGTGIALGSAGQVVIAGSTASANFPTLNPLQQFNKGNQSSITNDAFVTRLKADGSGLDFSTYLGGGSTDLGNGVALDSAGNIYVTGVTLASDFPTIDPVQAQPGNPPNTTNDCFVTKISATGTAMIYSTYLGGSGDDRGLAIATGPDGNAYVVGSTTSNNFPTALPLQPARSGGQVTNSPDGFIAKLGVLSDLAITAAASRNPVQVNNEFTLTLKVTNNGPSAATGVKITHQLPAGVNLSSAVTSQGNCANTSGTVMCDIGTMNSGAMAEIRLQLTPTASGEGPLIARVSGTEPDAPLSNNEATLMLNVSTQPSISGTVTLTTPAPGRGLANVLLTLSGPSSATQQTNAAGFYQFAGLTSGGSYTVTPSREGLSFEPASRQVNTLSSDQTADFVATPCSYSITPAQQDFTRSGGSGTITVTATPRCPWTASVITGADWISITSGANGSGNGAVSFNVAASSRSRVGRINVAGQVLTIWQGVGLCSTPKFATTSYYLGQMFPGGGNSTNTLAVTDFNNDGRSDLVMIRPPASLPFPPGSSNQSSLAILSRQADGGYTLTTVPVVEFSIGSPLVVNDLDGDGRSDLIGAVSSNSASRVGFYLRNSSGGLGTFKATSLTTGQEPPLIIEMNRDGRPDLLTLSSDAVNIALNLGNGRFSDPIIVRVPSQQVLGIADFTGDGVSDLLTVPSFSGDRNLSIYPGDGVGGFGLPVKSNVALQSNASITHKAIADLNGDGLTDVVLATINPVDFVRNIVTLISDNTGKLTPKTAVGFSGFPITGLATADVNGDARPDVLLSGFINAAPPAIATSQEKIQMLPGDGNGGLGAAVEIFSENVDFFNFQGNGPIIQDLNNDGYVDLTYPPTFSGAANQVKININRCSASGPLIFGKVTDGDTLVPIVNAKATLKGGSLPAEGIEATTDSGGNYQFAGLASGSNYTLIIERSGFEFTPATQSINNLTADQIINFKANRKLTFASAASYSTQAMAANSIAVLFGVEIAVETASANQLPLPLQLGQTTMTVRDSAGIERPAGLFFVSPNQINFLVPENTAAGTATITVTYVSSGVSRVSTSTVQIQTVAPGLFTADASGRGLAAALVLRVKADGSQVYEPVARYDTALQRFVAVPIDLSNASEQAFLVLFGTGLRNRAFASSVTAQIGGESVEVVFSGAQPGQIGLDQVNLRLPRTLTGRGEVDISLTVEGKAANTARVSIR